MLSEIISYIHSLHDPTKLWRQR